MVEAHSDLLSSKELLLVIIGHCPYDTDNQIQITTYSADYYYWYRCFGILSMQALEIWSQHIVGYYCWLSFQRL